MYDVIIIGKGPAGLSAALYTVRSNLSTLVIGMNSSAILKAGKIENYFGFAQPVSGKDLLEAGEKQVLGLGVTIIEDEVVDLEYMEDSFTVKTDSGAYEAKAVLIATGQTRKNLPIGGIKEFEGKGVSYCTTCDGFFYRKLSVGVVGSGEFALYEAGELEAFTDKITIFTNGARIDVKETDKLKKYIINDKKIKKFFGDEFLKGIVFDDDSTAEIDGVFIAGESATALDFARKLGVFAEDNTITVDKNQQTNIKGLFSAGDCAGDFKQISMAVGQGALAGRRIIEYIKREK